MQPFAEEILAPGLPQDSVRQRGGICGVAELDFGHFPGLTIPTSPCFSCAGAGALAFQKVLKAATRQKVPHKDTLLHQAVDNQRVTYEQNGQSRAEVAMDHAATVEIWVGTASINGSISSAMASVCIM